MVHFVGIGFRNQLVLNLRRMVLMPPSNFVHKLCMVLREHMSLSKSECVLELYHQPEKKKDDLPPTDDGEASEESHGAS